MPDSALEGLTENSPGRSPGIMIAKGGALKGRKKAIVSKGLSPLPGLAICNLLSGGLRPRLLSDSPPGLRRNHVSRKKQASRRHLLRWTIAPVVMVLFIPVAILNAQDDPRTQLAEMARIGARKPFLVDSPDVYLEPNSLNRFFTEAIYRRLQGNAYFGYDYDEGFRLEGNSVQIEVLKDLTPGEACRAAYRVALMQALSVAGVAVKPPPPVQIGVCIVGVESRETDKTLPGIMVEAYLRNALQKKSFFIRFGAGSPRGLVPAIKLSAEMLVSQLVTRRRTDGRTGAR
jgi:hypothetical protein